MATIRKRRWTAPSGEPREAWQVDFVDQAGKRRHKQFKRKKDAAAYLVSARGQVSDGTFTPDSSSATLRTAADLWLDRARLEKLERTTLEDYQRSVEIIFALIEPDTKLARLTTPRCEQLRDDLMQHHSRPMAQRTLKHFKAIVAGAQRRGLIAASPAQATRIGTRKRDQAKMQVGVDIPEPGEIKALIENATDEALAIYSLAAFAGLRASEIRGLRWCDVDLDTRHVHVRQRANRACQIGSPKSAAAHRTVPLSETTASTLKAWKLAQPPITYREDGTKKQRPAVLVFGTGTDKPDSLSNIRKNLLLPAQIAAGVALPVLDDDGKPMLDDDGKPAMRLKYGAHAFRHLAISSWLAAGIDLKACQHWAGHATLALTLDTYGHLIPRRDDHQRIADAERGLFG